MTAIGFIGLGTMGHPMVRRLAQHGHALHLHDIDAARAASIATEVAGVAHGSARAVAAAAGIVVTCLPSADAVTAVYWGGDGIHGAGAPVFTIDMSTIPPELARRMHADASAGGHLEAPMFGTGADAAQGSLRFLTAGDAEAVAAAAPVLALLGRSRHVGGPGLAATIKVMQNGLGLVQLVAIAEALTLAEAVGVDPRVFVEAISGCDGMADTPLFRQRAPRMLQGDAAPEAFLEIAAKDIALAHALADASATTLPLLATAHAAFAAAVAQGLARRDTSAVAVAVHQLSRARPAAPQA